MKYRWIYNQCTKVKEYCEEYVLKYAQKHGINYSDILRNGKHKRIKLKR